MGWVVDLLYVSQGDYWSEWKALATTTTRIRASTPTRSFPIASSIETIRGAISGTGVSPSVVYVHNAGDAPIGLMIGAGGTRGWWRICIYRLPSASRPG